MIQSQVPLMVLTDREDNVEVINRALREAGHAVHCHWLKKSEALAESLTSTHPELFFLFAGMADVAEVANACGMVAPIVPLVLVTSEVEETVNRCSEPTSG